MTVTEVSFFAYGNPAAQGSKKHVGHGVMVETSKQLPSWRASIIEYARKAYAGPPLDGALEVTAIFWFDRTTTCRVAEEWKEPQPDLDKLLRALGDALTIAKTIKDDARIVRWVAEKRIIPRDSAHPLGVDVAIRRLYNGEKPVTPSHPHARVTT